MGDELAKEFKGELRRQAIKQVTAWMLAGVVFLVIAALTGWGLYLQPRIDAYIQRASEGVPQDAVVAFDRRAGCPPGWDDMGNSWAGKVLVVAEEDANEPFAFGRIGGQYTNDLRMPQHSHSLSFLSIKAPGLSIDDAGDASNIPYFNKSSKELGVSNNGTGLAGGGEPHNNMQPYVAVYFCKKNS